MNAINYVLGLFGVGESTKTSTNTNKRKRQDDDISNKRVRVDATLEQANASENTAVADNVYTISFETNGKLGITLQEVEFGLVLNNICTLKKCEESQEYAKRKAEQHKMMLKGDCLIAVNKENVSKLKLQQLLDKVSKESRPMSFTFRHITPKQYNELKQDYPARFT